MDGACLFMTGELCAVGLQPCGAGELTQAGRLTLRFIMIL